jgi:hypothetical protein
MPSLRALGIAVCAALVLVGCEAGGDEEAAQPTTTVTTTWAAGPVSWAEAEDAVRRHLRNDPRGKPLAVDCLGGSPYATCNVEYEQACAIFSVEQGDGGKMVVRHGQGICIFSTETTAVGG